MIVDTSKINKDKIEKEDSKYIDMNENFKKFLTSYVEMKVRFIQKLKESSVEKLSYKIFIIFYNQEFKAQKKKMT